MEANLNHGSEAKETSTTAAPITVVETVAEAEKMGLEPIDLPNEPDKIQTFPFDLKAPSMKPHAILGMKTVRIIREKRGLDSKEYQMIGNILKAISSIKTFTADNVTALQSRFIMNCVIGEAPNTRGPYEFPKSFRDVAVANLARMDQEVEVIEVPEETPPATAATSPTETSYSSKRPRDNTLSRRSSVRQQPDLADQIHSHRQICSDHMQQLWTQRSDCRPMVPISNLRIERRSTRCYSGGHCRVRENWSILGCSVQ